MYVVLSGSEERCVCLGWALLPVFDRTTATVGISSSTRHTSSVVRSRGVRLALYEGSPRALYSMGHPGSGEPCVCVCVHACACACVRMHVIVHSSSFSHMTRFQGHGAHPWLHPDVFPPAPPHSHQGLPPLPREHAGLLQRHHPWPCPYQGARGCVCSPLICLSSKSSHPKQV